MVPDHAQAINKDIFTRIYEHSIITDRKPKNIHMHSNMERFSVYVFYLWSSFIFLALISSIFELKDIFV